MTRRESLWFILLFVNVVYVQRERRNLYVVSILRGIKEKKRERKNYSYRERRSDRHIDYLRVTRQAWWGRSFVRNQRCTCRNEIAGYYEEISLYRILETRQLYPMKSARGSPLLDDKSTARCRRIQRYSDGLVHVVWRTIFDNYDDAPDIMQSDELSAAFFSPSPR